MMRMYVAAAALFAIPAWASDWSTADIVILGEVHDNADAHIGQARVLDELGPVAVVFEMLTPDAAAIINDDLARWTDVWAKTNWPDVSLYEPIFDVVGNAVVVGAASSRETIRDVFARGPAAVFPGDPVAFGLDRPLPADQQARRETLQYDAHCEAMPREMMPGMVGVQRFRDAMFASVALEALDRFGPPVAVIVGAGHARADWGVPAAIRVASPDVLVHSLAFVEADDGMPFDEVRLVPEAVRQDPCDAFK